MEKHSSEKLLKILGEREKYTKDAVDAAILVLELREVEVPVYVIQSTEAKKEKRKRPRKRFRFLLHYLRFIKFPDAHRLHTTLARKLSFSLRCLLVSFIFNFLIIVAMFEMTKVLGVVPPKHLDFSSLPSFGRIDIILLPILIPFIAGFVEEFIYRLPLTKFRKRFFDISLALFLSTAIFQLFIQSILLEGVRFSSLSGTILFLHLAVIFFAVPLYSGLNRTSIHTNSIERNWEKNFHKLVYFSALIFAVNHLTNYIWTKESFVFLPLILLPYLNFALFFSLLRIRVGLAFAILMHILNNLIAVKNLMRGLE